MSFTLYDLYKMDDRWRSTETKYNPEKANNTKYSTTKLPWFSGLLPHSAKRRGGLILQLPQGAKSSAKHITGVTVHCFKNVDWLRRQFTKTGSDLKKTHKNKPPKKQSHFINTPAYTDERINTANKVIFWAVLVTRSQAISMIADRTASQQTTN